MVASKDRDNGCRGRIVSEVSEMTRYASRAVFLKSEISRDEALVDALRDNGVQVTETARDVISMCSDSDCPAIILECPRVPSESFYEDLSSIGKGIPRGGRIFLVRRSITRGKGTDKAVMSGSAGRLSPYSEWAHRVATRAGLEVVGTRPVALLNGAEGAIFDRVNAILCGLPLLRSKAFAEIAVLRERKSSEERPSLSIVIPARNERGTVDQLLGRIPSFGGARVEVIFVEGHSTDDTWEGIQSAMRTYHGPLNLKACKQEGTGKGDAVRLGFAQAGGDLLAILDADCTVPPEQLEDFYEAYRRGDGDFINGNRLALPMERRAMRPLNKLGNIFFSRAVSFVLDCSLGDTLCGTKLLRRADYERMRRWRHDFGDLDPFGDFELLFPAAALHLGIVDVLVQYKARVYGETNIRRFRHGMQLFCMVLVGLWRIRFGMRYRKCSPSKCPRFDTPNGD